MKKNKLFDQSKEKDQILLTISYFCSSLDLPNEDNVNALLEILKCYMAVNSFLKRFLQVFGKGEALVVFDKQQQAIDSIIGDYLEKSI